jgi:phage terminase large subunit-like protein
MAITSLGMFGGQRKLSSTPIKRTVGNTKREHMSFVEKANQYRADVMAGIVPACQWVRLAVKRAADDRAKVGDPGFPFIFDATKAERVCKFLSLLTHIQGPKAGERIVLENWQCFVLTEVFGWVWRETGTRRYRRAYLEVPKGNGKTILAAGIALYMMCADGEGGADVIATASSYEQARLCLDTARNMALKDPKLCTAFGINVLAHKIVQPKSVSKLRGLPAKGSATEGTAVHGAVLDELHLAKTRAVYDSLRTAASKRPQAMLFCITTAGNDISGVCYEVHSYVEELLAKTKVDESFWGCIWSIDDGDDWRTEAAWRKANPCWGISVDAQGLREEAGRALQLASMEEGFKQKHLCIWSGSFGEIPFLPLENVRKCYDANLKDDMDGEVAIGMDLASRLDLTAVVRLHAKRVNDELHYYAFAKAWLPEDTVAKSKNAQYQNWIKNGFLEASPGSIVDLSFVEAHLEETLNKYTVRNVTFDPLQSNLLVTRLMKAHPDKEQVFEECTQSGKYFTPGMLLLEELVADGRFHTNSPLLMWCLANLRSKKGVTNLLFPTRPKDEAQKIDAAVATIMGLTACSVTPLDESTTTTVYDQRGIILI